MGDVFLLGAGFSRAISDEMPLLADLSSEVRDYGQCQGIDLPSSMPALGDNLELWLSYLSQPHPWLRESGNLKNQATALEILDAIGIVLTQKERSVSSQECPSWLNTLTRYWHNQKSGVISFNYDTLVERAAATIKTGERSHLSASQLYPVRLTLSSRRDAMVFGDGPANTFSLFKLHGSINWFYSGATDSTGEVIYYTDVDPWGSDSDRDVERQESVSDKVPLIVPPTTEKVRFFQHESLKRMWNRAAAAIQGADRLFACGYSLPETDLAIRLFLHQVRGDTSRQKDLYVVNPDDQVVNRYYELLGGAFTIRSEYCREGAIERLAGELGAQQEIRRSLSSGQNRRF